MRTTQPATCIKAPPMDTYEVRNDGEWATISLRSWKRDDLIHGGRGSFGGEVMIHSSFGSWANSWNACGCPFPEFLISLDFHYVFTKFMGHNLAVYDGEETLKALKARIIELRRDERCDKEMIQHLWDYIADNEGRALESLSEFVGLVSDASEDLGSTFYEVDRYDRYTIKPVRRASDIMERLTEPWEMGRTQHDHQAVGFWRDIWPVFKQHLQWELEANKAAAA